MNLRTVCIFLLSLVAASRIDAEAQVVVDNSPWSVTDSVLTVSKTVLRVEAYAFADRNDIREVRFEDGSRLHSIGEYAFMGCSNLKNITLPASLRTLGEGCFRECGLTSLAVPDGVKELPKGMCAWNEELRTVSLPAGLADIAAHAFAYCKSLESIAIPRAVSHIGNNAFSCCYTLAEVTLPRAMRELESYAFSDCRSLRGAVMPANSRLLGELIFSGCENLTSIMVMSPAPPPFDCDSFIFEPDEARLYSRCRLYVPAESVNRYRTARGWKLFTNIIPVSHRK